MERLSVSIGICVYNEEKNIGNLLARLLSQKTEIADISDIYVISSGSTDETNRIVKETSVKDSRVKLLTQPRREGKASAINEFLKIATGEILVLESGDTLPRDDTIESLILPFMNPRIGMTGGHTIPVNDRTTFLGFTVQLQWEILHQLSREHPRFGELIAFKNVISKIPEKTNTDEAHIEFEIIEKGMELRYVPEAILYNKGPETIKDFLNQRRRIYAGHLHLMKTTGYSVSSMNLSNLITAIRDINLTPKEVVFCVGAAFLEIIGRVLGSYDFYIKKTNHYIWDVVRTTKEIK
jgi:biofilm PGA synthesis N-glycosyltransferase PgaC